MPKTGGKPLFWAVQSYRLLWTSNLLGDVGSAFASLALSVTAVTVLHASALQVAIIAAMGNGAYLIAGAIGPALGYDATIWIGTALMTASVAVFAASPLFRRRDLPPEWEHDDLPVTVQPR